jgi:hypothetical protein
MGFLSFLVYDGVGSGLHFLAISHVIVDTEGVTPYLLDLI